MRRTRPPLVRTTSHACSASAHAHAHTHTYTQKKSYAHTSYRQPSAVSVVHSDMLTLAAFDVFPSHSLSMLFSLLPPSRGRNQRRSCHYDNQIHVCGSEREQRRFSQGLGCGRRTHAITHSPPLDQQVPRAREAQSIPVSVRDPQTCHWSRCRQVTCLFLECAMPRSCIRGTAVMPQVQVVCLRGEHPPKAICLFCLCVCDW